MGFLKAEISFTVVRSRDLPQAKFPRWCVLGRSNVGKSSLLNAITHPLKIFRTGKTPGVTQGLVAARCQVAKVKEAQIEIVDTPGFGFVERRSSLINKWESLLESLGERSEAGLMWVWLVDPLRDPLAEDVHMLKWLGQQPFVIWFSKSDRVKTGARPAVERKWSRYLQASSERPLWVSAQNGEGLEDVFKSARAFVKLSQEAR
ncbi:MAG TPA: GTPase [Bdellovibrionota bacterium]|nr:GTPase [Bdellovibrionota bacterium]